MNKPNKIIAAVFDVDGVLSTGQFLYSPSGKQFKVFGPHDNDGIKLLKNFTQIHFVTADKRGFPITEMRIVNDMCCTLDLVSEGERYNYLNMKYGLSRITYMGDGIHDVPILRDCEFSIAPKSARREAIEAAKFITQNNAAEGAVLDACLEIIKRYFK